jgi:glycine/D-amino acid oxidase-like deaminating enzyme
VAALFRVVKMKLESFWIDTAPPFEASQGPLPARVDVAVVGAGFTGLAAARALARRGARVAVLEAGTVAAEASGRNGGHVNNGLAHSYATVVERFGPERAAAWYRAYDDAVDTVERVVNEERIDCDFVRRGKLKMACRPAHYESLARNFELLQRGVDTQVELVPRERMHEELATDRYFGALLYRKSAQMHMGRFGRGLAQAALRHGALIHEHTTVERMERLGANRHRLHTTQGSLEAEQVLLATGATRHGHWSSFGFWRRRIVPVGSFILVTEPLGALGRQLLKHGRTYTNTANINNYFRLTPDERLVWGGRARFALSSPSSDLRSSHILRRQLAEVFPQLAQARIDYCWGGLVEMTRDRLPRAGEKDGLFYSMGYSGHGTQMSVHMGECMVRVMAGDAAANPWRDSPWPAVPGYFGTPWFLPAVGVYYRLKDKLA